MGRIFYLIMGWVCVAVGAIGAFLPILPTTVFMILAAFLFTKGSPKARRWLLEHAQFGPHIQNWESSGAISPRAKRAAVLTMGAVLLLSILLGLPWWVILIQAICIGGAACFVLSRPDAPNAKA